MNREAFVPSELAVVDCLADKSGWTLIFVRELRHPPEKVWAALTDPEQLREWSPSPRIGTSGESAPPR